MAKIEESEEFKAAVKEAVEEETRGLKAKRDELLADNRKLKDSAKETEKRLEALEEKAGEADRLKAEKDGDTAKIREGLEAKHKKDLDKVRGELDSANGRINKLLIDSGLSEALTKKGVNGAYLEAATALIKSKHEIKIADLDGKPRAMIGDKDLDGFADDWVKGEHGKFFTAAPANAGGGAQGANGGNKGSATKTLSRGEFANLDPKGQQSHIQAGGTVTDQ